MRMKWSILLAAGLAFASSVRAGELKVTGIQARYQNGQVFVTWKDVAEGKEGEGYRYSLYRSDQPITAENFDKARLCYAGVPNNSARQFGYGFWMKDRLDASKPTAVIEEGGQPLPQWSGLAVHTVEADGKGYYAVVATDETWGKPLTAVVPGQSATAEAVEEKVAPIQPIKAGDSKTRGQYARSCFISGKENLPLHLIIHGSQGTGGAASDNGDLYLYFGTPQMGWRDGLPGIFAVMETHSGAPELRLYSRDAIENPSGNGVIETCWFGYFCVPVGAAHAEPRAYPFTENRLEWMIKWVTAKYKADPARVYSSGQSMGGMGSTQFSFRHPELFAAVYPRLGRVKQTWLPAIGRDGLPTSIQQRNWSKPAPMDDGKTDYFQRMDTVRWVGEHHEDLPFYGWCFGKTDTVAPWTDNAEMVAALTAGHHGFAFSWNYEGHSSAGAASMGEVVKYYPSEKFALDRSYPAFGHSSIDSVMGKERTEGDKVGGINLGFDWSDVVDEPGKWSAKISNALAKADMTVDVTPRRCRKFKPKAGEKLRWTSSTGDSGEVVADAWGLVTVEKLKISPGQATTLTFTSAAP
ncbi:MAG: hypothetical protein BIFFINMI_04085 [Phycisphaerae bacterium]|nr:hypothetical protein [Phycisphaerae bacterium]